MSEVKYASAEGFIQFDPQTRDVNGQEVQDITIKTSGKDGKLIRVTIWPEFKVDLKKGDWVAVDGKFTVGTFKGRDGEQKQSIQISATSLVTLPQVKKTERKVVNTEDDFGF